MKFEEALKKAKETARKDFIDEMREGFKGSMGSYGSEYDSTYDEQRAWIRSVHEKYICYSLSGTPPKAYLLVFNNTKKILCRRTINGEIFAVFDFEDEPTGSPSLSLEAIQ
jgi:hypothetical protein